MKRIVIRRIENLMNSKYIGNPDPKNDISLRSQFKGIYFFSTYLAQHGHNYLSSSGISIPTLVAFFIKNYITK